MILFIYTILFYCLCFYIYLYSMVKKVFFTFLSCTVYIQPAICILFEGISHRRMLTQNQEMPIIDKLTLEIIELTIIDKVLSIIPFLPSFGEQIPPQAAHSGLIEHDILEYNRIEYNRIEYIIILFNNSFNVDIIKD